MKKEKLQLRISGYVSEVLCGEIPLRCKRAFVHYLLGNRNAAKIPSWIIERYPNYVSPEEIKRFWYDENEIMREIFAQQDFSWTDYRHINRFFHMVGFGTGKEGLGLFEIVLEKDGRTVLEFVPFEPAIASSHPLLKMDRLKQKRRESPGIPSPHEGYVAVSSGSWAKGTIVFPLPGSMPFREEALEILVMDLTGIGIGEDYFVSGLRYRGEELSGEIIRESDRERYQVVWYSLAHGRWMDMYETGEAEA